MAEKFVVYVFAPPEGEAEAAGSKLAELLKLEPSKVRGLLRRLPDVVTRPVSEREAMVAGRRFQQAGFAAEVRDADTHALITRLDAEPAEPADSLAWADETEAERAYGRSSRIIEPKRDDSAALDAAATEPPGAPADDAGSEPYGAPLGEAAGQPDEQPVEGASGFGSEQEQAPAGFWQADEPPAPQEPGSPEPADYSQDYSQAAAPAADAGARAREVVAAREAAAQVQAAAEPAPRRRGSLRSKLLSTAIIPVLLTIVGALAATWFTARPALYDQLLESARNPAIATAATLSSTLERAGADGIDHLQLLETILITRQAFARQNLSFILATDTAGNPYSGSFLGGTSFPEESLALQNAVRERAVHAVQQGTADRTGWAEEGATSTVEAAGGQSIEIVAQPLMSGNEAIGAVVVGVTDQAVTQQVNRIVINVLLFSLIPLLLAILIAATRARGLTNNVLALTQKADEISRGDLDEPVSLRSNDELDDLSAALERMRVSMSGALERLRRRR